MDKKANFLFLILFIFNLLNAQTDTLLIKNINPITVSAPKINTDINKTPISVFKYTASVFQESQQQLSLQEYIYNTPGLFSMNANNYAQDLRISIRGFGARAAFGIRGIKLIVDGIPETTPDGQGQVDNLNLDIIKEMEIIRGPASSLYGNASGGVIKINSLNNFEKNFIKVTATIGSYNLRQQNITAGIKTGIINSILHYNKTISDGYRDHSELNALNFSWQSFANISKKSKLNILVNYASSPTANDPGGINIDAVKENRKQARDRNITFNAGERINQTKIGLNYSQNINKNNTFSISPFFSSRSFVGQLPFEFGGIVNLDRAYYGMNSNYQFSKKIKNVDYKLNIGLDMAEQVDKRWRYENLEGNRGALVFDQKESFSNIGLYLLEQIKSDKFLFSGGLRFDRNKLEAKDNYIPNGDDSGGIKLSAWNPSIGMSYEISPAHFMFTNFSTSFETPSLSELSANPTGEGGFNSLDPQKANNYELGIKGYLSNNGRYEVVAFHIGTKNELAPFELDEFPGRTFYRNSGKGKRNGLEFFMDYHFNTKINATANYTFSDFIYDKYELGNGDDFNGKQLPGIPKYNGSISLKYKNEKGLHVKMQSRYIGELFANDANTISDDAYVLINLNTGYKIEKNKFTITPFFGINNLLNTEYNDNIRINGFGGRYYEPGPELNFYGGVRVKIE